MRIYSVTTQLIAASLFAVCAAAQTPTFRTQVRQVRLDVQVVASDGTSVANLQKTDFQILDEGEPQPIVHFSYDSQPLDIVLLFDTSGSMKHHTEEVASGAKYALAALRPGDRATVWAFDSRARMIDGFLSTPAEIADALKALIEQESFDGDTVINRSIRRAADYLARRARPESRRTIVIFTDNVGKRGETNETVLRSLSNADATLNVMLYQWKAGKKRDTGADATELAEETGGDSVRFERGEKSFRDLLERLRQRYSIHYNAPAGQPGQTRQVSVDVIPPVKRTNPGMRVRARRSYVVPEERATESEESAKP